MSDTVIKIENLYKEYRLGVIGHGTLYQDLQSWWARVRGREDPNSLVGRSNNGDSSGIIDHVLALNDLNLEVKKGEILGIIGRNGAGKSTLLKIISQVTAPTKGEVKIKGRIGSLLEVGTGFHYELTGRENIYLNGAILGMTKSEVSRKLDEIIDFSGVETYIDTPVKRYSSGMIVRLAFAVAAHLEPEILLVDEVLAVGDAEFQKKCLGKMKEVTGEGRTILFVSHNMSAIRSLCKRTLLINEGLITMDGDTHAIIDHYLNSEGAPASGAVVSGEELEKRMEVYLLHGEPVFECKEIALLDKNGQPSNQFTSDEEITVSIIYECLKDTHSLKLSVDLTDTNRNIILRSENLDDPEEMKHLNLRPGLYRTSCVLPKDLFGSRQFYVTVSLICKEVQHLNIRQALSFDVKFLGYGNNYGIYSGNAYIRPELHWLTDRYNPKRLGR